jgi:hypothetical protein
LGFYDAAHTASDGSTYSGAVALNSVNRLIGFSENPETGHRSGWSANPGGQINPVGLTDAAHTSSDGRHAVYPVAINAANYIIGNSDFFAVGEVFPGATSWLRRPDRSIRLIGFQSGVHRAPNGQHVGRVERLTESGYMAGWSTRYRTTSNEGIGQTAWVTHVDGPNRPVGFYTGVNLGQNGVVHSYVLDLNENGNAMGTSFQYVGANPDEFDQAGSTAWVTTPAGVTVRVGLYDAEHTVNGRQFNEVAALNASGSVAGYAARYLSNGDYFGSDGFVADAGGTTTKIGLTDAIYVRNDGYHASFAGALTNASGIVAGHSERYNGGAEQIGQTAWIYSRSARTYVRFVLSVRSSDRYAESTITTLQEDGTATGRFRRFASDGTDLGERAFVYVPGKGAFELDAALDVTPGSAGWAYFADAAQANANGYITGAGARTSGSTHGPGVYLVNKAATTTSANPLIAIRISLP